MPRRTGTSTIDEDETRLTDGQAILPDDNEWVCKQAGRASCPVDQVFAGATLTDPIDGDKPGLALAVARVCDVGEGVLAGAPTRGEELARRAGADTSIHIEDGAYRTYTLQHNGAQVDG